MKKRLASNNGLKRSLGFFVLLMIFFQPYDDVGQGGRYF